MRRASDIEPEAIDWTWRHRIAQGKLSLLAGEPGLGKYELATKVVAIVTTGAEWPCGEGRAKAGGAIMLCAEDGMADTIVPATFGGWCRSQPCAHRMSRLWWGAVRSSQLQFAGRS